MEKCHFRCTHMQVRRYAIFSLSNQHTVMTICMDRSYADASYYSKDHRELPPLKDLPCCQLTELETESVLSGKFLQYKGEDPLTSEN